MGVCRGLENCSLIEFTEVISVDGYRVERVLSCTRTGDDSCKGCLATRKFRKKLKLCSHVVKRILNSRNHIFFQQ